MNIAAVLGFLFPSPLGSLRSRIEANPTAPDLPTQSALAALQNVRPGIRGGLSGLSGSEADYADGQATPDVLAQNVSAHALPPSMFVALANRQPSMAAYDQRPVVLGRGRTWGATTRGAAQLVVSSTLLPPTARTPSPYAVAAAHAASGRGRLTDPFEEE